MDSSASESSFQKLDDEFGEAGVPLRYRPLDCFKRLYGSVPDGVRRQELFHPIVEWYLSKYGDSARWDGVIARFPVLIRGKVYLGLARFVASGEIFEDFRNGIENLPEEIAKSITLEEFGSIGEKLALGDLNFRHLHNLIFDDNFLGETERGLVRRALYDLENAAVILKNTGDTQSATVLSHEAAEKFFKAALRKSGSTMDLQKLGHDVRKAFKELLRAEPRYSWLSLPVENLQRLVPNMEMRYGPAPRSLEAAVSAYHGALHICGVVSQVWLFDRARGTDKATFRECRFYLNGAGNPFYCKRIQGKSVTLTFFHSSELFGARMGDMQLDMSQSAMYLEVTDPRQDAQLRYRLSVHLRNPGRRVTPEEMGLSIVKGPEGSYATAMLRMRVERPCEEHKK